MKIKLLPTQTKSFACKITKDLFYYDGDYKFEFEISNLIHCVIHNNTNYCPVVWFLAGYFSHLKENLTPSRTDFLRFDSGELPRDVDSVETVLLSKQNSRIDKCSAGLWRFQLNIAFSIIVMNPKSV